MNLQIEKMQMLYAIEKSLIALNLKKQKKLAALVVIAIVLAALTLLSANIAIFLYIADLSHYANKAWLMVVLNSLLTLVPIAIMVNQQKSAPEKTITEIRDALADDLRVNVETTSSDIKDSVEKLSSFGKDIKILSDSGFYVFNHIVKLATGMLNRTSKNG
ncbi:hypothetical protein [Shewanella donghaensis]|uniref:hypothetical protein n=1 Tax=Shewanella donghaensis TaxID=238836 RepID=UPI0011824D07|nr:hypothetical protein [Shewanella donghaensis]